MIAAFVILCIVMIPAMLYLKVCIAAYHDIKDIKEAKLAKQAATNPPPD